jgi:two-component system copper resistance phosphate regulon response regulator CusR
MHVLIVEDEERLASALKKGLEAKGYAVDSIGDGAKALNRILMYRDEYDLVILDLGLPGMSGAEVLEKARADNVTTPILVLTATTDVEHKISLLNSGADDYLCKPFSFDELVSRITALLRRPHTAPQMVLTVADLEMNTSLRQVKKSGRELTLTLKEYALLECFMRQPNEVLGREKLMDKVWDFNDLKWSNVLDVHMKNLRHKLACEESDQMLQTIRGVGYKIVG